MSEALEPVRPALKPNSTRGRKTLKLTGDEMVLVARMAADGRSAREIARLLATKSRPFGNGTISRFLKKVKGDNESVYQALSALRGQAVEDWALAMSRGARDGRHAPAKDLLMATGVIKHEPVATAIIIVGAGPDAPPQLPDLPAHARVVE